MTPDCEITLPQQRSGIYHLVRDGRVVYVGQSTNLMMRIGGHSYAQYDSARIFYCDSSELDEREKADIERLQPELNCCGVSRKYTGVFNRRVPWFVKKYGSVDAYFDSLDRIISGNDIRNCGIKANNNDLLAIEGFPEPTSIKQVGNRLHCLWPRDDVRQWIKSWLAEDVEAHERAAIERAQGVQHEVA